MVRHLVTLILFCPAAYAGRVTATFPLPNPGTVVASQQDATGNVYLAGYTGTSTGSPTDSTDAFVAKLSSDGALLFWTTFGGGNADSARAMVVAPDGSVTVVGLTASLDFPLTPDAAQTKFITNNQGFTGFFTRLDSTGKVKSSSYLNTNVSVPAGTSAPSFNPSGLALDTAGSVYITGGGSLSSTSGALPATTNAGWIQKLDASGKTVFATGSIGGDKIAVDSQGFIYVVGSQAASFTLPVTPGAFQASATNNTCGGNAFIGIQCSHSYVVKLDPTASKVIYATWISGSFGASAAAMAVDSTGNVTLAGNTASTDYPVTSGAYQPVNYAMLPPRDSTSVFGGQPLEIPTTGFVTKLNATGTALIFSTYLGGSSLDAISSIAMDSAGRIYLGGVASSPDFPGLSVVPDTCRPNYVYPTAFVTRLSGDGSSLSETQLAFGLHRTTSSGTVALDGQGKATAQLGNTLATLDLFAIPTPFVCMADAADFAPLSSVAPGQLVTLFGEGIGPNPAIQAQVQGGFIPVTLGFSSLSVTFNDVPAPILYGSSGQVNVQVPYEIANASTGTMKLQYGGRTSTSVFSVVASQPSVFLQDVSYATCNGDIRESFLPLALNTNGSFISCANRAPRGATITIFLNGLGLAGGNPITGAISNTSTPSSVSATTALNPQNTGFSTEPVTITTDVGQINGVWLGQLAVPAGAQGSSLQLALTVNGVAVRDSLVIWLQ